MNTLLIIDGNALIHRAYHALPDFKAKDGVPTNAVYGFISVLHKVKEEVRPSHLLVCFDTPAPTFRDALFADYRTQRPEIEADLRMQFPMVREFLDAAHISRIEHDGIEADDLIAIAAKEAREEDMRVVILTADKDIFQLVSEHVSVLTPAIGYTKSILYDPAKVEEKFGVPPHCIPDLKALMGDPSDNYKGVKGIGPKTAVTLIKKYGTIENIYATIDTVEPDRVRALLVSSKDDALIAKKLAVLLDAYETVTCNVPATVFHTYHSDLCDFLDRYQFRSLSLRIMKELSTAPKEEDRASTEKKNQLGLF